MWPAIFESARVTLAVVCTAFAVKLVDDFLDLEQDRISRRANWTMLLGRATVVYGLLCLAIGASIHPISLPLFFASYIVGMFNDLSQLFPSRLAGWQESLLVFIMGYLLWGWRLMFISLFFVVSIQLLDDCYDTASDQLAGHRNLAHRFGSHECLLAATCALLLATWLASELIVPLILGTVVFVLFNIWLERKKLLC